MKVNIVSSLIWLLFLMPVVAGAFSSFSRSSIRNYLITLLDNIEFLITLFLSVFLTKKIFFNHENEIYEKIYVSIPQIIKDFLQGHDILTYVIAVPAIMIIITLLMRLISFIIDRLLINYVTDMFYYMLKSMNNFTRRIMFALGQIPKALSVVFIFTLLLNFTSYYLSIPMLNNSLGKSEVYQVIYDRALYPVLNSSIAKKIPVIVNDTVKKVQGSINENQINNNFPVNAEQKEKSKIKIIEYFNGVTLEDAVKSNSQIDNTALRITKNANKSREKAYSIYRWITENIEYDYDKAQKVSQNPEGISSGSIIAFETGKGICFDYSSLYVSMCRSAGIGVRLITGLGYSGTAWGDHAWNQVYIKEEDCWINVDTTFGTQGNYFDNSNFSVDHRLQEIQKVWE